MWITHDLRKNSHRNISHSEKMCENRFSPCLDTNLTQIPKRWYQFEVILWLPMWVTHDLRKIVIEISVTVSKCVKIGFPRVWTPIWPKYQNDGISFKLYYDCLCELLMIWEKIFIEISVIVRKCVKIASPRVWTPIWPNYQNNGISLNIFSDCLCPLLMFQKRKNHRNVNNLCRCEIVLHKYLTCGFPYRISNVRMWISIQLDRGSTPVVQSAQ